MAAFLFKVFTLTIRTVAKPLSKQVEAYVLKHPTLRKPVIDLAQVSSSMHFLLLESRDPKSLNCPTARVPCAKHVIICTCLQVLHRLDVRVNRGAEGKSAKVFVGDLSEENALELAGKVISETFVWLVRAPCYPFYFATLDNQGMLSRCPPRFTRCASSLLCEKRSTISG